MRAFSAVRAWPLGAWWSGEGALSCVGARRFHCDRFFLKLIKLLMLLTLNKNHTILQMSGRVDFLFMKDWDSVGTGDVVHTFKFHFFSGGGSEGKFKLKLNWPFPIEAAGILLNETPSLHGWFVAYSFFFESSPFGVVPEDDDVLWWSVFWL